MRLGGVWFAVVVGALACSSENAASGLGRRGGTGSSGEPQGEPMPHQECAAGGGSVQALDVNGDGQPDVRTVMSGAAPQCRETDANFDGRVDILRWFDGSGRVTRVEDDYDFDGRIDVVATYENGQPVRDILDTNFDGRTDTWRDYRDGRVAELRRDSDGDGRVDTWERFDGEGRLTWSAHDGNRDGEPDPDGAPDAGAAPPAQPAPGAPGAPAVSTMQPTQTAPTALQPAPGTPTPGVPAQQQPPPRAQKTREVR